MACFRCLHSHWRKNGHCHLRNPPLFYLRFFSHLWLAGYFLFDSRFLDEHQKLYQKFEKKSAALFVKPAWGLCFASPVAKYTLRTFMCSLLFAQVKCKSGIFVFLPDLKTA